MPAVPAGRRNASLVRKWLSHDHIPQRFAPQVTPTAAQPGLNRAPHAGQSAFARDVLSPYLYFHHPCLFATEVRDAKGKVRRRYRRRDVATPYEKLKSLPDAERFPRPGITFADLDEVAYAMSDLEANRRANRARDELFRAIGRAVPTARVADPRRARGARPRGLSQGRVKGPLRRPRRLHAVPRHAASLGPNDLPAQRRARVPLALDPLPRS